MRRIMYALALTLALMGLFNALFTPAAKAADNDIVLNQTSHEICFAYPNPETCPPAWTLNFNVPEGYEIVSATATWKMTGTPQTNESSTVEATVEGQTFTVSGSTHMQAIGDIKSVFNQQAFNVRQIVFTITHNGLGDAIYPNVAGSHVVEIKICLKPIETATPTSTQTSTPTPTSTPPSGGDSTATPTPTTVGETPTPTATTVDNTPTATATATAVACPADQARPNGGCADRTNFTLRVELYYNCSGVFAHFWFVDSATGKPVSGYHYVKAAAFTIPAWDHEGTFKKAAAENMTYPTVVKTVDGKPMMWELAWSWDYLKNWNGADRVDGITAVVVDSDDQYEHKPTTIGWATLINPSQKDGVCKFKPTEQPAIVDSATPTISVPPTPPPHAGEGLDLPADKAGMDLFWLLVAAPVAVAIIGGIAIYWLLGKARAQQEAKDK